jgi:hypothetical protein
MRTKKIDPSSSHLSRKEDCSREATRGHSLGTTSPAVAPSNGRAVVSELGEEDRKGALSRLGCAHHDTITKSDERCNWVARQGGRKMLNYPPLTERS